MTDKELWKRKRVAKLHLYIDIFLLLAFIFIGIGTGYNGGSDFVTGGAVAATLFMTKFFGDSCIYYGLVVGEILRREDG